jgi:FkbM family methyltransferase
VIFKKIKSIIISFFQYFNIGITSYSRLKKLSINENSANDIEFLLKIASKNIPEVLKYFRKSKSQIKQDLFVLSHLNFKKDGFFVEFGATDGIALSNTYLLEKEFNWRGILAEPGKNWHKDLKNNRSANIETKCVWKDSISTLAFNETEIKGLSTINQFSDLDSWKENRKLGKKYNVETISLNKLLNDNDAPKQIDYLSIDTEGSEFEILNNFDFTKYSFKVITCEHNFTLQRNKIFNLLSKHGYKRVYENISQFDDWYIK